MNCFLNTCAIKDQWPRCVSSTIVFHQEGRKIKQLSKAKLRFVFQGSFAIYVSAHTRLDMVVEELSKM